MTLGPGLVVKGGKTDKNGDLTDDENSMRLNTDFVAVLQISKRTLAVFSFLFGCG